ncbi:hypothetical protein BX070DRAFT_226275 [Coemansia spiralis]|nr:hypothetical protein BX070DRAFT_226275 [Coemansia spiralis]
MVEISVSVSCGDRRTSCQATPVVSVAALSPCVTSFLNVVWNSAMSAEILDTRPLDCAASKKARSCASSVRSARTCSRMPIRSPSTVTSAVCANVSSPLAANSTRSFCAGARSASTEPPARLMPRAIALTRSPVTTGVHRLTTAAPAAVSATLRKSQHSGTSSRTMCAHSDFACVRSMPRETVAAWSCSSWSRTLAMGLAGTAASQWYGLCFA